MRPPKKSETLEVRLSYQDKTALQDKAAQEGRSVSAVVRNLISNYLSQPVARSTPNKLMELLMALKSKPKSTIATFAIAPLIFIPFLFPISASAGDIALTLESEYTEPAIDHGVDGKRVRRAKTEIEINDNQFFSLPIATGLFYNPDASVRMSLRFLDEGGEAVKIELFICEVTNSGEHPNNLGQIELINSCDGERLIAKPELLAKYGETAEFHFEIDNPIQTSKNEEQPKFSFDYDNRKVFRLKASPKKL